MILRTRLLYREYLFKRTILDHIQSLVQIHLIQPGLDIPHTRCFQLAHKGSLHIIHAEGFLSRKLQFPVHKAGQAIRFGEYHIVDKHTARSKPRIE